MYKEKIKAYIAFRETGSTRQDAVALAGFPDDWEFRQAYLPTMEEVEALWNRNSFDGWIGDRADGKKFMKEIHEIYGSLATQVVGEAIDFKQPNLRNGVIANLQRNYTKIRLKYMEYAEKFK